MAKIHAVAFSEAVDQTLDNIAPVADGILRVSGDDLLASAELPFLAYAYFGGASMERARLVTQLLRTRVQPDFKPVDTNTDPGDNPPVHDFRAGPLQIIDPSAATLEAINVRIENDGAAGATDASAFLLLTDGPIAYKPPPPDTYPVRFTGTDTPTPEVWDDVTLSLDQTLRPGIYDCWGVHFDAATGKFWRVVPNMPSEQDPRGVWRPGGLCVNGDTERNPTQVPGFYGQPLFRFRSDNLPTFQYLCDTNAAQAPEGQLWVRKVA